MAVPWPTATSLVLVSPHLPKHHHSWWLLPSHSFFHPFFNPNCIRSQWVVRRRNERDGPGAAWSIWSLYGPRRQHRYSRVLCETSHTERTLQYSNKGTHSPSVKCLLRWFWHTLIFLQVYMKSNDGRFIIPERNNSLTPTIKRPVGSFILSALSPTHWNSSTYVCFYPVA